MDETRIAYCGVNCADCPDLTGGQCPGCRQTEWNPGDEYLPVQCCRNRGIAFCGTCPSFPCAEMERFYQESESHAQAFVRMQAVHAEGSEKTE